MLWAAKDLGRVFDEEKGMEMKMRKEELKMRKEKEKMRKEKEKTRKKKKTRKEKKMQMRKEKAPGGGEREMLGEREKKERARGLRESEAVKRIALVKQERNGIRKAVMKKKTFPQGFQRKHLKMKATDITHQKIEFELMHTARSKN